MKALKIALGVVAVLAIGLVVFLATFDIGKYKGLIQDQAKAATGRELVIGGIHMAISLTPTVVLDDVTFSNAPWGSRPQMVTVKRIEATASLLPLLSGKVSISKIALGDADVLLEVNKQGKANWEFEGQEAAKDAKAAPAQQSQALNIDAIDVNGLKLAYKEDRKSVV